MKKRKYRRRGSPALKIALAAMIVILCGAVGTLLLLPQRTAPVRETSPGGEAVAGSSEPIATVAGYTAPASGNTARADYSSDYSVPSAEAGQLGDTTVAKAGSAALTNSLLQVYYRNAIASWQQSGQTAQPDAAVSLASQSCPAASTEMSWQQFFLQRAVSTWYLEQAVQAAAAQPQKITEEAFRPNQTDPELHAKYIAEDLPVNNFLYGDKDAYEPNSLHQSWLDALPDTLTALAADLGDAGLQAYVDRVYGSAVSTQDVLAAAESANMAYMYFTEVSYTLSADPAGVQTLDQAGASATADIRQILLIPENASEAAWDACRREAEQLLSDWKNRKEWQTVQYPEASFAQLASERSQDAGSRLNGGLYSNVCQGQLIGEVDAWVFDPARKAGNTAVIRSALGYHIVYLSAFHSEEAQAAEKISFRQQMQAQWQSWLSDTPLTVDYIAAALWCDTAAVVIAPDAALYPDVGHERFPEAIVYLQQDYFYARYGTQEDLGRSGCGPTTFAMLATYMTDTLQTPAMVGIRFGEYRREGVTDGSLFQYPPAQLGFYFDKKSYHLDEIIAALENGQPVVILENNNNGKSVFTSGGHFLLLTAYDASTGLFQVRDSNIYNYGDGRLGYEKEVNGERVLGGHRKDGFSADDILSGFDSAYILQSKIVRIPACSRCGGTFSEGAPEGLLQQDYICEKCQTAQTRREAFLQIRNELM